MNDWGIMGLACRQGKVCVISTINMKTNNQMLFNDRFNKVAVHELQDTMGLQHCRFSWTWFIEAVEGTVKLVDRGTRFLCSICKKIIQLMKKHERNI